MTFPMLPLAVGTALGEHVGFPLDVLAIFAGTVALSVYVDLFLHRGHKDISIRDASIWTLFWIGLAGAFYFYLRHRFNPDAAALFLAGYTLEKTLSVDNLMVFIAIFSYFRIHSALQHRILYWGILGALLFRLVFVAAGNFLLLLGPWADLLFAAVVGWSAWKMLSSRGGDDDESEDYDNHRVVKWAQGVFAVIPRLLDVRFFVRGDEARELARKDPTLVLSRPGAGWFVTPAFICLILIETSDVMFAFDSVPAVIAVTREPLLIYSAMIFAILGLRSLYFVLAALTRYLVHLEKAVIGLLFFISAKLLIHATNHLFHWPGFDISPGQSLVVILAVLAGGVVASFIWPEKEDDAPGSGAEEGVATAGAASESRTGRGDGA